MRDYTGHADKAAHFAAEARTANRAIAAVLEIHAPIDALNVRYPGGRLQQVCTGCGQDDGNWNPWPCPTVQAIQTESERKETRA